MKSAANNCFQAVPWQNCLGQSTHLAVLEEVVHHCELAYPEYWCSKNTKVVVVVVIVFVVVLPCVPTIEPKTVDEP